MTSRWTFLRPWLSQLTMKYKEMDLDYDARGPPQRMIKVYLRRAGNVPEAAFQVKCSEPWCGLFLGKEGEEMLEEKIPVRDEYLEAMRKIAAMDRSLKDGRPGLDIEIPVMLCFHAREEKTMLHLENAAKAERIIQEQWELYYDSHGGEQPVESKMLRCTFVLEPMIADLYENGQTKEMAETVGKLLDGNVWFSQVKLPLRWMRGIENDASGASAGIQSLIPRVFGSTRRSLKQANSRYRPCFKQQNSAGGFTQIGEIEISCDSSTTEASAFEQACSALKEEEAAHTVGTLAGSVEFADSVALEEMVAGDAFGAGVFAGLADVVVLVQLVTLLDSVALADVTQAGGAHVDGCGCDLGGARELVGALGLSEIELVVAVGSVVLADLLVLTGRAMFLELVLMSHSELVLPSQLMAHLELVLLSQLMAHLELVLLSQLMAHLELSVVLADAALFSELVVHSDLAVLMSLELVVLWCIEVKQLILTFKLRVQSGMYPLQFLVDDVLRCDSKCVAVVHQQSRGKTVRETFRRA
ncbi:hypothetical protein PHYSODRAFT_340006 [Phytophthora sojae]|uniref:Uncharacterized protein n=1 Tax=Phytophthora sojae (strain P6497) TaxID=1094619 RepID=G5A8E0_PHYSP|nr:hypothetical protein PHYSODRAFT_340006 [Phytophthora sojae]EGZ08166.1 hypothetical protein PHYSODRAFT_340006 [Phytophthora sojae]|eukprot:XP_009536338.1 hypothetical protein PHYSODRAFT_340006 [Phytophthora sojae]